MTQPPVNPAVAASLNLRGAVDLSALKNTRPAPAATAAGNGADGAGGQSYSVDVTEANFQDLVQLSAQVPVVVSLGAAWSAQSANVLAVLESLVAGYAGRLLLGRVDAEVSPQIAQAFGATAVPTIVALVKGQPVPLFEGELPHDQIERYLSELVKVAAANGVDGALGANRDGADAAEPEPLPPLHQAAFDAIEAGDLAAAEAAYTKALAEMPTDGDAKIGLAQVHLMQRTAVLNTEQADVLRRRAADAPEDLEAQLAVADLDVTGGHIEDAFARIVGFIKNNFGAERESARVRLLELFDVVGVSDPRVAAARQALARALF
ncbi:tetratricopeptide repeat protein [Arthrobacter sp. 35W]|uniref:tetratricopeptide repeat protein n=1 Tax=Arthrobacter sp. 35W TaxID=1132441 RepID=UPI000420EDBB|nr:tetratricopeptide repeat protein [Arthrobacter sp. 35W]